jgi:peptidoglycan/LPS O-acetylase OafA/YrhL
LSFAHHSPIGYWQGYFSEVDLWDFLQSLVFLQELAVPDTLMYVPIANTINASLWTIKYEFLCYLIVPFLHLVKVYRSHYALALLFLASFLFLYLQDQEYIVLKSWAKVPIIGKLDVLPRFLTYFLAGMCFEKYGRWVPRSFFLVLISLFCCGLGLFVYEGVNIVIPVFGSYVLFSAAFTQVFTLKNFSKYGDFSYGLYVYAWPLQQLIIMYFEKHLTLGLLFLMTLLFVVPLAWLSWHYIEKPFLKLKKRRATEVIRRDRTSALIPRFG